MNYIKTNVLLSLMPVWCNFILKRIKTGEIRKNKPSIPTPFKCFIYMTKNGKISCDLEPKGKVIGEFICGSIIDRVVKIAS